VAVRLSIACAASAPRRAIEVTQGMRLAKIFTSLSCGVPVIHAGAGEGARLLERESRGLLVPPQQPHDLANAIIGLAADPGRRDAMARAGRALIERDYSW